MPTTFVPSVMDNDDGGAKVQVVEKAVSSDAGDDVLNITHVLADDNQFLTDTQDAEAEDADVAPELVYTYDDDDIFIDSTNDSGEIDSTNDSGEAREIDLDTFEAMIDDGSVDIQVIAYDVDGTSIFRVKADDTD